VVLLTDEDFFAILLLLLLFEPSSISATVDVDITDDVLSIVDCNILPLVCTPMFFQFNFRHILFKHSDC
jgi:hypothetical protein